MASSAPGQPQSQYTAPLPGLPTIMAIVPSVGLWTGAVGCFGERGWISLQQALSTAKMWQDDPGTVYTGIIHGTYREG